MAKILIISANLKDWTKNSGGKERTATLAEALLEHDVTFLSFSWENQVINKKINDFIYQVQPGVKLGIYKRRQNLINGIAKPNHDIVFELLKAQLSDFSDIAKDLAAQSDLLILDHYSLAPLVENISGIPIIYNSHNSEITMGKQLYSDNYEVLKIVEKMEKSILKQADAITYCSKKDFNDLENHYGRNVKGTYIPNGTIIQNKIDYKDRLRSRDIIFVGSGHPPNNEAAKYILKIAKLLPEFNFIIIGSCGNGIRLKEEDDNIKVLGEINSSDLDKYFRNSFAFINPMKNGSGTHLKMMKALSYGIPIITSTVGARGFSENEINEAMLIANTENEIIDKALLLKQEKIYKNICENAYKHAKNYDWEKIKKDYATFINGFVELTPKKKINNINKKREKILVCSIVRNDENFLLNYYNRLKTIVSTFPEYEFYLSIYENDSIDNTKKMLFEYDYSMFSGVSIVSENINTKFYGSSKDEDRVKNLAEARNKSLCGGSFLNSVDYVLVIDIDVEFKMASVEKVLNFKDIEPNFDVVAAATLRKNFLYDQWATRDTYDYDPTMQDKFEKYRKNSYKKYYSVSSGFCFYRAEPFKKGVRWDYINRVTKKADCEMVVICQDISKMGYNNIYMAHDAIMNHNHR